MSKRALSLSPTILVCALPDVIAMRFIWISRVPAAYFKVRDSWACACFLAIASVRGVRGRERAVSSDAWSCAGLCAGMSAYVSNEDFQMSVLSSRILPASGSDLLPAAGPDQLRDLCEGDVQLERLSSAQLLAHRTIWEKAPNAGIDAMMIAPQSRSALGLAHAVTCALCQRI